jgi:hypothetical protein
VTTLDIKVQFKIHSKTHGTRIIEATEAGVDLTDDEVQISASSLAYGLVEEAWGFMDDEDD